MGRSVLPDDQKRKQVAVRLSPDARARIGKLADENGRSLGVEIERLALDQLAHLEATDAPTRQLLQDIEREIAEIRSVSGKRWHVVRDAWSAVVEMLRIGPISAYEPDKLEDDPEHAAIWKRLLQILSEKGQIADRLLALGVTVTPDNPVRLAFGAATGVLDDVRAKNDVYSPAYMAIRHTEHAGVEALPDGPQKDEARHLFDLLTTLDVEENDLEDRWDALCSQFRAADTKGRKTYHAILRERARRQKAAGEPYSIRHFLGIFR